MKYLITFLTFFLIIINTAYCQTAIISGKVTSGIIPVVYANVSLDSIELGSITDSIGFYSIKNIPSGNYSIKVSCVGYESLSKRISIKENQHINLDLNINKTANRLNEFVVTGVSKATLIKENPLAMESISTKQIEQTVDDNVIDAISKNAPGFEAVKTGPNVSKPFINGLGYNRVLTLYDGMRVETQQWGDEHGVPIDDYIIEKAEIIKGPASLLYGSDAIAGVLSLFPAIPHDTDKVIHGRILSEYQTNNGLIGNGLRLTYANAHLAYALRASERIGDNYSNPIDGKVNNTGFKMENASALIGYSGKNGYSHLNCTFYNNRQGIPDGSRDSITRKFTYQVYETQGENSIEPLTDNIKNRPIVPDNILNSYDISPLSQRIQDYRLYSDNLYKFGESDINLFIGGEQNIRREFDHPTDVNQAGMYVQLNTIDYGIRYNAPTFSNIESSCGLNGMYQTNNSLNATDFPIPNYNLFDIGTYAYAKWKHHKWTIAGGFRYDNRNVTGDEMYIKPNPVSGFFEQVPLTDSAGGIRQFNTFHLQFKGLSGSIGTTFRLNDDISLKANIARGYRSPNITEIASNGLDPGAHIVYEGNLNFVPEFSLQEDVGISGAFNDFSFDISAFNNNIQNYIYEAQEVDKNGNPVVIVPGNKTFQYQQSNAQLYGMNATVNINPRNLKGFHYNNAFSLVYGFNLNPEFKNAGVQGEYLPFIPPPRVLSSVSYDFPTKRKTVSLITLKAEADDNLAQNRYLALYNTETPTAGYTLLNLSLHANINYTDKHIMQIEFSVNNLLNTAYQSHLSRLQYFEYYKKSPNGHSGIYNMGRNICIRIIVPF